MAPSDLSVLDTIFQANRSALLICDMQNDYVKHPRGNFERVKHTLEPNIRLVEKARSCHIPVIYTRRIYRKDGLHSSPMHRLKNIGRTPITVEGTWGAEIIDELKPQRNEVVIDKIRYSGFFQTPLETILHALGISFIFMTGGSTHWGVEATARDAEQRDFIPIVISDATHSMTDQLQEISLMNIGMFIGFVISSGDAHNLLVKT